MALPGDRAWQTPSGWTVRCDEVRVGDGPPVTMIGLPDDDLAHHDAWARITIVDPPPEHAVWVHQGSEIAIGPEIWRVDKIAESPTTRLRPGPPNRRKPGPIVVLTREV
jgi:hypothetical protein